MKIVYMGNNQRGIACLETLARSRHEVVRAIAQTSEKGWYESIHDKAKELGIPVEISDNPNNPGLVRLLKQNRPDLIVMCGYSKIIGQEILQLPLEGCINLHASKLPWYRGAAPLNWALINGEKEIGLSIYKVDRGIDTGEIYAQETFEVSEDFTIRDALDKTLKIYPRMLLEVCDKIENGTVYPISQDPSEGTYFTKRRPKDGEFNWASHTAEQVHNKTRALTHPYPGAFFIHNGKKYFVWKSNLEKKNYHGIPGRVAARHPDGGVTVITKDRGVRLIKVQEREQDEKDARELFKTGEDLI